MGTFIEIGVEGDKAVIRELGVIAREALPTNVIKKIFKKSLAPVKKDAKWNARRATNKGGTISIKSRRVTRGKYKLASEMANAIGYEAGKTKKYPLMMVRYIARKLTTEFDVNGRNVPAAHWKEGGTNDRKGRGRIGASWALWRGMQTGVPSALRIVETEITSELQKHSNKLTYITFRRI